MVRGAGPLRRDQKRLNCVSSTHRYLLSHSGMSDVTFLTTKRKVFFNGMRKSRHNGLVTFCDVNTSVHKLSKRKIMLLLHIVENVGKHPTLQMKMRRIMFFINNLKKF